MVDRRDSREDIGKLQVLTDVLVKQIESEKKAVELFKVNMEIILGKLDDRLRVVERNMYIAFGILVALQFLLKFIHL